MRFVACTASGALAAISRAQVSRLLRQRFARDDLFDQPQLQGLLRRERQTAEGDLRGAVPSEQAGQVAKLPPLSGRDAAFW